MVLVQKEIKKVYLGTNQVRPAFTPRTFTISWTEKSNMASWWTYSDDAAWLTAWSGDFDDFFWYSAVLLNTSGVETAEMKQTWWVFTGAMTTLGTLSGYDNVMIKFPARWIKLTKSWTTVTLSITDWLNRESEWYQYYAFQTWTLSSPWTPKDVMYLWAYKWASASSKMWSWSWIYPSSWISQSTSCTYAKATGSWYNIMWFYQRMYINALYMMKYWNPNSQSVVWQWLSWWSSNKPTWATDSITNATWATDTSSTWRIKLFWLEDRWGNLWEWLWGMYVDNNKQLYTMLNWWSWARSWWTWTWITINGTWWCISSIAGNNSAMFIPIWTVTNSNYNTYYSDYVYVLASCLGSAWWSYDNWARDGLTALRVLDSTSDSPNDVSCRLMYLNWLT